MGAFRHPLKCSTLWTLWFMIASSIFSMVLCGVKEFGFNSFEISVLKGVSQSWLSLWRMHNLKDASWEHSDILWSVPHCGHFVDIDERSSKLFFTHLTGRKFSQLAYKFEVWNSCFFFRTIKHLFNNIWLLSL